VKRWALIAVGALALAIGAVEILSGPAGAHGVSFSRGCGGWQAAGSNYPPGSTYKVWVDDVTVRDGIIGEGGGFSTNDGWDQTVDHTVRLRVVSTDDWPTFDETLSQAACQQSTTTTSTTVVETTTTTTVPETTTTTTVPGTTTTTVPGTVPPTQPPTQPPTEPSPPPVVEAPPVVVDTTVPWRMPETR
jgi:hypothetical protein